LINTKGLSHQMVKKIGEDIYITIAFSSRVRLKEIK